MGMTFQYRPADSFMHRIDPISKVIWMLCLSILVFLYESALPQFLLFVIVVAIALGLAKLSVSFLLRGIWIIFLFSIGFFVLQVLLVPGHTLLFQVGFIPVYLESVDFATSINLRILTIFTSSLIFVVTSDPRDIVLALTQKLKVPYRYAYSIFVALRFVPTLETEAKVIEAAQTVRGVGRQKGLRHKLENMKRFTLPLLMSSIRRVHITAITMEAKGYGAYADRTYIRHISILKSGIAFSLLSIATTLFLIILKFI
jgi:energy-coupling factor transport system permease protein